MKFTAMLTKFFAPLFLALTIIVFLASCKGEVGPKGDTGATGVGTTGATGATGPTGASGVAGATGPAGASGVAGVSGTSSVTQVTYATSFTLANDVNKFYNMILPSYITKTVIDKSLVMVYMEFAETGNQVYQIPGTIPQSEDTFGYIIYAGNATVQNVAIYRTAGTAFKTVTQVRVLVIPAANVVNGRKAAVDYSNYGAVKAYYGLTDY